MYFLARHSKIYGPFDDEQFSKLKNSNRIFDFTWIWSERLNAWEAVDPAPNLTPSQMPIPEQSTPQIHHKLEPAVALGPEEECILFNHHKAFKGVAQSNGSKELLFRTPESDYGNAFSSVEELNLWVNKGKDWKLIKARIKGLEKSNEYSKFTLSLMSA